MTETQIEFLDVLEKSLGIVSVALQKTETTREEYEGWLKQNDFNERLKRVTETSVDYVENKLLQQINQGDLSAIQFYLKTKGKKRGY